MPIHNTESERQLRSLVVGRANWLSIGSDDTAQWSCTFVSLVASCQLHEIDPEGYMRDLFRVLPVWPRLECSSSPRSSGARLGPFWIR